MTDAKKTSTIHSGLVLAHFLQYQSSSAVLYKPKLRDACQKTYSVTIHSLVPQLYVTIHCSQIPSTNQWDCFLGPKLCKRLPTTET